MKRTLMAIVVTQLFFVGSANAQEEVITQKDAHACINSPVIDCADFLKRTIKFDDNPKQTVAGLNTKVDVNGNKVVDEIVNLDGEIGYARITAHITVSPENLVKSLNLNLRGFGIGSARTSEEYKRTQILELFRAALPMACTANPDEFFRYVENIIKPAMVAQGRKVSYSDDSIRVSYVSRTPSLPFCGQKIAYRESSGTSSILISLDDPSGSYSYMALEID